LGVRSFEQIFAFSAEPISITGAHVTKNVSGEGGGTKKLRHHGHEI